MVFPILMFPAAILFGLTELLIPELARCNAAGRRERIRYIMHRSLRVTLIYGTVCSGILFLAAPELCRALYGSEDAGRFLRWFAPLAVMLYCDIITDAMNKGLGQQKASVRYNILTSSMDVAFLFFLLPKYGISGYYFSFLITHLLNFGLSIRRLMKITDGFIRAHVPTLTIAAAVASVWICSSIVPPIIRVLAFLVVLICALFLLRILDREDLTWLRGLIRKK